MKRRKTAIFFLVLGISLSALAVALNVGWIILSIREAALLVLGIIFFGLIITGLILNTVFLVREIRKSEQHDAFLNAVTHELKTPIASIRLYLETLKTREVTEEKRIEFYDIMLADSDRLLSTVNQVLQAGSLSEKKKLAAASVVDVARLLEETAAIVTTRHKLPQSIVRISRTDDDFSVRGDEGELSTAFMNLFDNAVKYSSGEPKISVRVRGTGMSNNVVIMIRDHGVGIPPADLKRVFKRFHRVATSDAKAAKGTGLGLFIVKSIIEKHGGDITAESKGEGTGSTFFINLPRA